VVGVSSVSGNSWIGGDLSVSGTISGSFDLPTVLQNINLNNTTGITTLSELDVTTEVDFSNADIVGLGNTVCIGSTIASGSFGLKVDNGITVNDINVTNGIVASSGFVTCTSVCATGGFKSTNEATNYVQIDYASSPDRIIFNVIGIGSTSLLLF